MSLYLDVEGLNVDLLVESEALGNVAHRHEHVLVLTHTHALDSPVDLVLAKLYVDYLTGQLHHCEDSVGNVVIYND